MNPANQTIIDLLEVHQPADDEERKDVDFIRAFAQTEDVIFGKANPLGHITGSALVLDPQHRVLLTYHAKLERWLQLGGHSDPQEINPAQTALREGIEESGLNDLVFHPMFGQAPIDIDVHRIPERKGEAAHDHLDFRYVLLTQTPDALVMSAESKALRWVPLAETDHLGFDHGLKRAIQKCLRHLS